MPSEWGRTVLLFNPATFRGLYAAEIERLGGVPELADGLQPGSQLVPTSAVLVHHLQLVDSTRAKSPIQTGVRTKIGKTDSTSPQSVLDRQKRQPLELSDVVDEADCVEGARAAIIMARAPVGVPVFWSATRIEAETRSTSDSNGVTVNAPIRASA